MVLRCRLSISLRGESDAKTAYKGGYSGNSSHCFSPLARWFAYLGDYRKRFWPEFELILSRSARPGSVLFNIGFAALS
jgi:hypothetical protein